MSESFIFAHFLSFGEQCEWIAHFAQIKWAMWANRSGRSPKMSDHERFAQVAHQKCVNEQIVRFFKRIAHSLNFSAKTSNLLRKLERISNPEFVLQQNHSWDYLFVYLTYPNKTYLSASDVTYYVCSWIKWCLSLLFYILFWTNTMNFRNDIVKQLNF